MKNASRIFCVIAACCIILGAVFLIVGFSMGGNIFESWHFVRSTGTDEFYHEYDSIKTIDIEMDFGTLLIKRSETPNSRMELSAVNIREDWFEAKREDDKLVIAGNANNWLFGGIVNFGPLSFGYNPTITLVLPDNFKATSVKIKSGAGTVTVNGLDTGSLNIELGAGAVEVDMLNAKRLKLSGGVGECKVEGAIVNEVEMDSGVGKIAFDGIISEGGDISSGVGEIDMNLVGSRSDYGFNINTGLGECRIDGEPHSGYYGSDSKLTNRFDVECGVGSINIDFSE